MVSLDSRWICINTGGKMIGKLRPQIYLAIIVLGLLSGVGVWQGMNEIATGCTGGIIALGMKVLESE